MREGIHPEYYEATVTCAGCGTTFVTGSTVPEIKINVCSNCHPFYSGKQKIVDSEGRVDAFKRKYAKFQKQQAAKTAS
ncbi:MAG: 50S ribosomal protein L31 [Candidatus Dadabacteria bacterium]|nr:MAG: 50S ribosomal protein L31 [Candidatus Dadabacteria bacterium]